MSFSLSKRPRPPLGDENQEIWQRNFLDWTAQLELTSVVGLIKKPNPNGGYSLINPYTNQSARSHPYQLYPGSTWLKWKVRAGKYIYTPTGDIQDATNVDTEITITSGVAEYWFYIDLSTGVVAASSTRPDWSATVIPIGYVDTTNTTDEIAAPMQFCTTHIFSPCA